MLRRLSAYLALLVGVLLGVALSYRPSANAARNASGTYSLPSGNPVVTGTAISSTVYNNTKSDMATEITDSLSRSGKGAMLAPLELANGSVGTPALSFDSDTDCGLYRIGTNNIGLGVNGANVLNIQTTGLSVVGTLSSTGNGSVGGTLGVTGATTLSSTLSSGAITSSGNITLSGSDPSSSTGFTDTITPTNVTKAWAHITLNGSTGAQTINSGFNITSATVATVSTFGELTITFENDFAGATSYAVSVSSESNIIPVVKSKTAGTVVVRFYVAGSADPTITANLASFVCTIQAVGAQ
jgi:hypothetical protein